MAGILGQIALSNRIEHALQQRRIPAEPCSGKTFGNVLCVPCPVAVAERCRVWKPLTAPIGQELQQEQPLLRDLEVADRRRIISIP